MLRVDEAYDFLRYEERKAWEAMEAKKKEHE